MGYLDLKMSRIRAYNTANGRRARMKKIMDRKPAAPAAAAAEQPPTTDGSGENVKSFHRYMNWELKEAAEGGDVEFFITILEKVSTETESQPNTILEQRDYNGNTYLHVAVEFGRHELVGLLTNVSGCYELIEQTNDKGDTPLHVAAKTGHFAVTDLLLRSGKEGFFGHTKIKNGKGNTPLLEALLHNHQSVADLLLESDAYSSCYVNNEGKSALSLVVEAGDVKTYNAMYKASCSTATHLDGFLEEHLMKGRSLLHAAISNKDKVMLQEILAKGMCMLLHVKDEHGQTPIDLASTIGFEEGQIMLRDELSKDTTDTADVVVNPKVLEHIPDALCSLLVEEQDEGIIQSPDWNGRHESMRKLLTNLILPQQCVSHRCMDLGLYEAAKKGDIDEFISALEIYSVEQNLALPTIFSQLTLMQNTFLHVASRYGHKYLVWLIVQYFPSLFGRANSNGNTAFHLAAKHGHLDIVKIFVTLRNLGINDAIDTTNGMQMVVENADGRTPLQLALKDRHKQVVEFLIKENVEEAYHVNMKGTSSLYIVILNGKTKLLKNILSTMSQYVDQNVLDDQLTNGKSLVLAAIWSQKIDILQELARQKPVLFRVKDEHAQKLVHFAELLGFHEGANYLRGEFKLEIVLDGIVTGVVPPLQSYDLDAYSLSVIEMVDQKIEKIMQLMHQNGRFERMKKLFCSGSLQHMPQKNWNKQSMDVKLYEAAKNGDVDSFIDALEKVSKENNSSLRTIFEQRTHIGNTFLHVAASRGNEDLTSFIVFNFRCLLRVKNREGNTANHEAARAGHVGVLDVLAQFNSYYDQLHSSKEYDNVKWLSGGKWHLKNSTGNTSLHEAFASNQTKVIEYLMESSVEEAYYVNNEGKSGLHLAVEAAMVDSIKTLLSNLTSDVSDKFSFQFASGRSLINAAIREKSTVMLQEISRNVPAQVHVIDEDGQTPLFYAASIGFLEGLTYLLDEVKMPSSQMNSTGFYPVHVASKCGHVHILQKLMQNYPDAGGFRNRKSQNILHVAAMYAKDNVVRFILQTPDLEFILNEKDVDGNTPLHLATISWHPKIVSSLTWDHRVNLTLVNKDGLTALDVAEEFMEPMTSFQQRLTWSALISAGTPRAVIGNKDRIISKKHDSSGKDGRHDVDYSKDRVNTLLLVATLVATVTFAAGFTMPGGYINTEPKQGQATLLHKLMLQTFVICDTVALYSAIMVAVTLIWAQLGDMALVVNALKFALPLLGLSLTTMLVAFMVAVSLVVAELTWLANFVLIFGMISLANVLTLFIPLCLPSSATSPVLRYITYYSFHFLVLVSENSDDRHIKAQ
ncbi:hypothetical protein OSB04_021794 [Centaurea solstitialis]|uniref:PGG domain-containing protein n=1 Tax=Centaurea solstitialis TaxID=347529 RepID=A0AA38T661_9ASTR|nr:hypothetical protein OSB04_021794 [Centaurea solstitialis]